MRTPVVALPGPLDTKAVEYAVVKEQIERSGCEALVIDISVLGGDYFEPDIHKEEVAAAAGTDLAAFAARVEGDTRVRANRAMSEGLAVILKKLTAEGKIDAVLGMGGTGGTDSLSAAFRQLPLEMPKMLVSTMASNNTKPYVGNSDMIMMYSVTDIAGLNSISRVVLSTAAHAACGMAQGYAETKKMTEKTKPLVAITMWGVTTPFVMKMRGILEENGFDVVVFHAVGEGSAMEELIDAGVIDGVIDAALPEILNHKLGGIFDAGPDRMSAAARRGIPELVVPGAIEAFNFGAAETIPEKYNVPERCAILHNPNISSLRATPEEMLELADYVAEHVNRNPGPKEIFLPTLGLDLYMSEGSPWFGKEFLVPMFERLKEKTDAPVTEMENHINDAAFAEAVARRFMELYSSK